MTDWMIPDGPAREYCNNLSDNEREFVLGLLAKSGARDRGMVDQWWDAYLTMRYRYAQAVANIYGAERPF